MSEERDLRFNAMREYRKLLRMLNNEQIDQLDIYEKENDKHNEFISKMGASD